MFRKKLVLVALVALLVLGLQSITQGSLIAGRDLKPAFVPDQVLVNFQPGITTAEIATFYAKHGLVEKARLGAAPGDVSRLRLAQVKPGKMADSDRFIRTLAGDARVEYAELNYILSISLEPNDPDYSQLWGMDKIGAPEAWDITTGLPNIIVGVIDTGVNYNHPDLAANIWTNPGETGLDAQGKDKKSNGVDDDGNGYVDDVHGWNAYANNGDPMDDHFHGSHVAGTIGASGNNGVGVVGVSWMVRIAACKFLSASGSGSTAGAIQCFDYFNKLRADGHNVLVTNNSWGGGGFSQALEDAMAGDVGNPILHAAAAGNSANNNDASPHYPSSYDLDNIIAVAATDSNDNYASFSSYGKTSVDLAGPGVSILSTVLGSGYGTYGGTSMATPHVAGAAALIWAAYPGLAADKVKDRLLWNGDYIGDVSNNDTAPTLTNGRLNVFKSLEYDSIEPFAVTNLAVPGAGMSSLTLTWLATGDDGATGTASYYDVRYSTSPITGTSWDTATQATGEPSPQGPGSLETFKISGLSSNTTYYTAVKAMDNVGNASPMSNGVEGLTKTGTTVFEDDMDEGINGWTTSGSSGLWHQSTHESNSLQSAWYYGQEVVWHYDTGAINSGTLTSPQIDLTGATEAVLSFSYWRQVEDWIYGPYDQTYVDVSYDGGPWTRVWQKDSTDPSEAAWNQVVLPLNTNAEKVKIRFSFDTVDGVANTFEGWYIDDVIVIADVPELATGTIMGKVTQAVGDTPIAGASIEVVGTSLSATTGVDGTYSIVNVPADTYNVTASASGFESLTKPVTVASTAVKDFSLVAMPVATPGITVNPTSGLVTTEAGGADTFSVVLDSQPTADVAIGISSSNESEGSLSISSLTFTSANWDTPQMVTVTGVDDGVADGDVAYAVVTAPADSTDPAYSLVDAADVAVTNTDDDTPGISVSPTSGLVTTEAGGTANFTVELDSQPTDDVTVTITSDDTTEGTVSPSSLTFTDSNWNTAQTVTVTGVDDAADDGDVAYAVLTAPAASGDSDYDGFDAADVSLTNMDNDTAGITVAPTSGLVTTEAGGSASFTVELDSQPADDVTIAITSSNDSEGTVSSSSLTFTSANWNTLQTVTVTGVDDAVVDGDVAYTVVTAPAAGDSAYIGLDAADIAVTNMDDETPSEPTTMHVGDLDGASTKMSKGAWSAQVTVLIYDSGENPLVGAEVTGTFTQNGDSVGPLPCTTGLDGTCTIDSGQLPKKGSNATFTVDVVSHATLSYQPGENHDPEGDSNGTTIALSK